jgi:hypothetical protein
MISITHKEKFVLNHIRYLQPNYGGEISYNALRTDLGMLERELWDILEELKNKELISMEDSFIKASSLMSPNFEGKTFVAFVDISGFKNMSKNEALGNLHSFYNAGNEILSDSKIINGLFISDCGILYANNEKDHEKNLRSLLESVKKMNLEAIANNYMLTTSIAFGDFQYYDKIEFERVRKIPLYGNAYLNAFYDSEDKKDPIRPGQCRILNDKYLKDIGLQKFLDELELIKSRGRKYYYYYWMLNHSVDIEYFTDKYGSARKIRTKKEKYAEIFRVLDEFSSRLVRR